MTTTVSITDRAAAMASQFLNGTTDGIDPQDVAGLLGELCSALTAAGSQAHEHYQPQIDALISENNAMRTALCEIAAMGKKAGSETAKNALHQLGIDWETGEPLPDYGSMT